MPVLCLFCFAFLPLRFRATSPVSNLLGHVLPFCPVITGCLGACWAVACAVHRWLLLSAARGDLPESRTVHPPSLAPPALRDKLGTCGFPVLLEQADCLFPWFWFLFFFFLTQIHSYWWQSTSKSVYVVKLVAENASAYIHTPLSPFLPPLAHPRPCSKTSSVVSVAGWPAGALALPWLLREDTWGASGRSAPVALRELQPVLLPDPVLHPAPPPRGLTLCAHKPWSGACFGEPNL